MFEQFDRSARRVVVLAQEQARLLDHGYIGTEHLLLGLLAGEGPLTDALERRGATLEGVRYQVEEIVGRGPGPPTGHIPFTPRAKEVLELSLRETLRLGHRSIVPAHVLLGLLREGQGLACQVLVVLGVELSGLRAVAEEVANAWADTGGAATPGPTGDLRPADARAALQAVADHLGEDTRLASLRVRGVGQVQVVVRRGAEEELEVVTVVDRGNGWAIEQP
jgi:ATP-dependent Clp protease ATP-binding subunit ClpC